ncbi:MAG: hypothetical protein HY321_21565 [Armatimonadetes bacterium]|nr:hypothetical protein [Armatimonadota bacterium]
MPNGEPRERRLRQSEQRRITRLLASLPRVEPAVEIRPNEGTPFAVDYREDVCRPVAGMVGAESFYAFYGTRNRRLREADFLRVHRAVRYRGAWHLEVYTIGGAFDWEPPHIIWSYAGYRRRAGIGRREARLYRHGSSPPWHLGPDPQVCWLDAESAEGPEDARMLAVGHNAVCIGDRTFECLRAVDIWRDREHPDADDLVDAYLTRDGRTALIRRFRTAEQLARERQCEDEHPDMGEPACPAGEELATMARLRYNGVDFHHWADVLTSAALAPPRWRTCRWGIPCGGVR